MSAVFCKNMETALLHGENIRSVASHSQQHTFALPKEYILPFLVSDAAIEHSMVSVSDVYDGIIRILSILYRGNFTAKKKTRKRSIGGRFICSSCGGNKVKDERNSTVVCTFCGKAEYEISFDNSTSQSQSDEHRCAKKENIIRTLMHHWNIYGYNIPEIDINKTSVIANQMQGKTSYVSRSLALLFFLKHREYFNECIELAKQKRPLPVLSVRPKMDFGRCAHCQLQFTTLRECRLHKCWKPKVRASSSRQTMPLDCLV